MTLKAYLSNNYHIIVMFNEKLQSVQIVDGIDVLPEGPAKLKRWRRVLRTIQDYGILASNLRHLL